MVLWHWLLVCVLRTNYSKLCLLPGIVGMTPVHFVMCLAVSSLSQFLRHQLWPRNGSADTTKMGSFLANHQVPEWFVLFKNRFQGQQKKNLKTPNSQNLRTTSSKKTSKHPSVKQTSFLVLPPELKHPSVAVCRMENDWCDGGCRVVVTKLF